MTLVRGDALPVLVVDDDSQLLHTLVDVLQLHGYRPATAPDGRRALESARARTPALALVDLRLPDMDGLELVHRLHQLSSLTQVIILTGNASVDSAVRALREQSCDYLVKPVAPAELIRTMATAGERWQRYQAEAELSRAMEAVRVSEERYRTIVETAREGVCVVGPDGAVTYANTRMGRLLDCEPAELRGRPLVEVFAPEDRALAGRLFERPLAGLDEHEFRLLRRDGESVWAWISTSAITDAAGRQVGALAMVTDVTERRQLEERIRRAQKLDAVGRLAGGVAHDFNNLLSVILAEAELTQPALATLPDVSRSVGEIKRAAERATVLVRQLLAFSRSGPAQTVVFSPNDVIADLDSMLRRLIGERVTLTSALDPAVPGVRADRGQIEQVLTNLVVNARDAMPAGGSVALQTRRESLDAADVRAYPGFAPGGYAMLSVSDTGSGMSDEVKAHLFEPFFTTKAPGKGTGLGMATSYGIVKRFGGHITVYSEVGRGTNVQVLLPAAGEEAPGAERAGGDALPRGGETVLLVEDDAAVRAVSARVLRAHGYEVFEATDAEDALRVLEATGGRVHLLLTDIVLPTASGEVLAERVLRLSPGVRAVFASGYPEAQAFSGRARPPGSEFLQKPLTATALLTAIRRVLDAPALSS